jgi:hypothetical protein
MNLKNGKWVKFSPKTPITGAHTLANGKVVGIFVKGGVDGLNQEHVDRINVVDSDGQNIPYIKEGTIANVSFALSEVDDLEIITSYLDLPPGRKGLREGFLVPKEEAVKPA